MSRLILILAIVVCLAGFFGVISLQIKLDNRRIEAVNDQWRKAAAPIFEARGVPNLALVATPRDLAGALDANSVMTRAETSKWLPGYVSKRTKITIALED